MKKALSIAIAVGTVSVAGQVFAAENWTTRLPGVTEGLASGAVPPAGLYAVNETLFTPTRWYGADGKATATHVDAFVDVPILEWAPGVKLLGADYAAAIAFPFDYDSTTAGNASYGKGTGIYDTLVMPGILSWSLPADFHVATQLGIWVPDGDNNKRIAVRNSNRYWAVEPGVGVSWLHEGWAASVLFTYDFNFQKSADNTVLYKDYQSGDQFIAEYSVTDTIGKWTFGFGGYGLKQVESDHVTTVTGASNKLGSTAATKYAIGPIAGYNFGPVIVQAYYHQNLLTKNYVGGDEFWTRVLIPF
jgi:hypothetical protein